MAKALEKDPARRYASAAELAADLRRWLAHEPIQARPPSALYHLRKFARRNRGLVGGVLATGVALVLGLVGTILFAIGESRQRQDAETSAAAADRERRAALRETYQARLTAATTALRESNVEAAARQLDAAPPGLRGWEWQHLQCRVADLSSVALSAEPEFDLWVACFPAGSRLIAKQGSQYVLVGQQTRRVLRVVCDVDSYRGLVKAPTGLLVAYAHAGGGTTLLDEAGAETVVPLTWPLGYAVSITRDRKLCAVWGSRIPKGSRLSLFELPSGHLRRTIEVPETLRRRPSVPTARTWLARRKHRTSTCGM